MIFMKPSFILQAIGKHHSRGMTRNAQRAAPYGSTLLLTDQRSLVLWDTEASPWETLRPRSISATYVSVLWLYRQHGSPSLPSRQSKNHAPPAHLGGKSPGQPKSGNVGLSSRRPDRSRALVMYSTKLPLVGATELLSLPHVHLSTDFFFPPPLSLTPCWWPHFI